MNHPRDPGGATNWGITLATLAAHRGRAVGVEGVRALSRDEARAIYRKKYWQPIRGDAIPAGIDLATMDPAVNSGVSRGGAVDAGGR